MATYDVDVMPSVRKSARTQGQPSVPEDDGHGEVAAAPGGSLLGLAGQELGGLLGLPGVSDQMRVYGEVDPGAGDPPKCLRAQGPGDLALEALLVEGFGDLGHLSAGEGALGGGAGGVERPLGDGGLQEVPSRGLDGALGEGVKERREEHLEGQNLEPTTNVECPKGDPPGTRGSWRVDRRVLESSRQRVRCSLEACAGASRHSKPPPSASSSSTGAVEWSPKSGPCRTSGKARRSGQPDRRPTAEPHGLRVSGGPGAVNFARHAGIRGNDSSSRSPRKTFGPAGARVARPARSKWPITPARGRAIRRVE